MNQNKNYDSIIGKIKIANTPLHLNSLIDKKQNDVNILNDYFGRKILSQKLGGDTTKRSNIMSSKFQSYENIKQRSMKPKFSEKSFNLDATKSKRAIINSVDSNHSNIYLTQTINKPLSVSKFVLNPVKIALPSIIRYNKNLAESKTSANILEESRISEKHSNFNSNRSSILNNMSFKSPVTYRTNVREPTVKSTTENESNIKILNEISGINKTPIKNQEDLNLTNNNQLELEAEIQIRNILEPLNVQKSRNKNKHCKTMEYSNSNKSVKQELNNIYKSCSAIQNSNNSITNNVKSTINILEKKFKQYRKEFSLDGLESNFERNKQIFIYGHNNGKYLQLEPMIKQADLLMKMNDETAFKERKMLQQKIDAAPINKIITRNYKHFKVEKMLTDMRVLMDKHKSLINRRYIIE